MKAWENNVRKVIPYVPGEQPRQSKIIKLNTNENPYPPAPAVAAALHRMEPELLRRYPDPASEQLVGTLADYYGLEQEQVFVGVGSDDVLALAFLTFFNSGKPILFPDITYSFYDVWADLYQIPYEKIPLDEAFCIRQEDYQKRNGGIIFPNPNAPTGLYLGLTEVEKIVAGNPEVVVIIDEAYIDFGGKSALPLLEQYDNLLIVQTFSKSRSMAGMRIGYAMGNKKLIGYLNDVKYSFNSYTMNQTSLVLGCEAVRADQYFKETLERIIATREWTKQELKRLGFFLLDSQTNFIFAEPLDCLARDLFQELKKEKIYVRYFNKPRIDNFLRITIGTEAEMQQLIRQLERILQR